MVQDWITVINCCVVEKWCKCSKQITINLFVLFCFVLFCFVIVFGLVAIFSFSLYVGHHWQIYYQPASSDVERSVVLPDYEPGSLYTLEGLSPNTAYNIRVTASTDAGEGEGARATETTTFGGIDQPITLTCVCVLNYMLHLYLLQCIHLKLSVWMPL